MRYESSVDSAATKCKKIILLGITASLFSGCAFTPTQLNANQARYDGVNVMVRGFVRLAPEAHVFLYESQALYAEYERGRRSGGGEFDARKYGSYCVNIANPELLQQNRATFDAKTLTFQGKFVEHYPNGNAVALGACPLPSAIIVDNAALARRYRLPLPKR